jgi:hypothetical protein
MSELRDLLYDLRDAGKSAANALAEFLDATDEKNALAATGEVSINLGYWRAYFEAEMTALDKAEARYIAADQKDRE